MSNGGIKRDLARIDKILYTQTDSCHDFVQEGSLWFDLGQKSLAVMHTNDGGSKDGPRPCTLGVTGYLCKSNRSALYLFCPCLCMIHDESRALASRQRGKQYQLSGGRVVKCLLKLR